MRKPPPVLGGGSFVVSEDYTGVLSVEKRLHRTV